jgi:hypothetical protein
MTTMTTTIKTTKPTITTITTTKPTITTIKATTTFLALKLSALAGGGWSLRAKKKTRMSKQQQ